MQPGTAKTVPRRLGFLKMKFEKYFGFFKYPSEFVGLGPHMMDGFLRSCSINELVCMYFINKMQPLFHLS